MLRIEKILIKKTFEFEIFHDITFVQPPSTTTIALNRSLNSENYAKDMYRSMSTR